MGSYQILPNQQQPPPLMKDSKSLIKTEQSDKIKKNEKIKKQQQQDKEEKNNSNVPQSTPMMFPFGNQSPTMFPQNVGPMQSPLFSMNNVPQTPYYQSTNNANNAFLPDPNPNAHNVGNHHSSLSQYHSFGHTAFTLPMPLSLPMSNQMMQSKEEKEPKNEC